MTAGPSAPSREVALDGALVAAAHVLLCLFALARGFDHVSDDDFARVTIAQAFAHAPRLDPSGTSWLPFPFWVLGLSMTLAGRSLVVARVAHIALASAAAALPYLALRSTGASRKAAFLGVAIAFASPWSLWLGAATVPESFTASFATAAVIALGAAGVRGPSPLASLGFALALLAACLSRYEPWPVAAVLAAVVAIRAIRVRSAPHAWSLAAVAAICAAGPLLWMAWNAHAHDGALHFFRRVATFKREIGGGATDTAQAVLFFPRLLASMRPDLLAATACALPLLRSREVRSRWAIPLACGAAQVGFLALGNARDGAPAHHSERALLATTFILACFAADVLVTALPALHARARGSVFALVTVLGVGWIINFRGVFGEAPGETPLDDRRAQIAEGARLRGSEHLVVTPCTYEHFALIASFGAPERVETLASSREAPSASCPRVERR